MTAASLWDRLRADHLVEGELPEEDRPESPWYVRVMLGIAGWIGAGFLLSFVGVAFAFITQDAGYAFVLGAACCAGALALFRGFEGNDFAEQFGLALSLAGQMLIIIGLAQFLKPENPPFYFAVAATQVALALAVTNFLHRALAAGGAAVAVALAADQLSLHGFAAPFVCLGLAKVWLEPKRWACGGRLWRPIGYGLVLALLLVETFGLFGTARWLGVAEEPAGWIALHGAFPGRALTAAVLVWVAVTLAGREDLLHWGRIALSAAGAAILFGLLSLEAPGLASAVLVLLLGFAAANRILAALGILSLLGFVTHFYYSLHASLLEKSGLLAATGLCLLAAFFLLRPGLPSSGAADHDDA